MTSAPSLPRIVLRTFALSVLLGAAIATAMVAPGGGSFRQFLALLGISTVYSGAIGIPAAVVFPRLRPRIQDLPALTQWLIYFGTLLAIAAAGTLVAGLVLVAIGIAPFERLRGNYFTGLQITVAVSVPITIGAVTFARLRRRLARTEASLQDKELDHQRALGLATEARLASLESRVRPHFLFNALNSAIALIPDDPRRAESVLERLAHLLRFSLDAASSTVALGDELTIATDYLEIERVRFGDRLRYDIDVPAALRGAKIPAFAVQTVVENSVKYAVSVRKAGAHIAVRGWRDGDRLRLEITDDGPGFAGPIWLPGHGLDGVRARLHALYGTAARIIAPAPVAAGAGVTIELPAENR